MSSSRLTIIFFMLILLSFCTRTTDIKNDRKLLASFSFLPYLYFYDVPQRTTIYELELFDGGYLIVNGVLHDSVYGLHYCQLDSLSINMIKYHLKKIKWNWIQAHSSRYVMDQGLMALVYVRSNDTIIISDNTEYTRLNSSSQIDFFLNLLENIIGDHTLITIKPFLTTEEIDSIFVSSKILIDSINKYQPY